MHLKDRCPQFGVGVSVFGALGQRNPAALGELLQRFVKADAVYLLDKLEDVASLPAAEAFVELMIRVNTEGWSLFGMERAETGVTLRCPYSLETNVLAY